MSAADAVVVERRRSEPRVVSFARATLGNALIRGAAVVGLPLLLLVVLAFVRWRTPTATQVRGLLALAIVAVVVARILADPTRTAVERGLAAPPLVWPSDWSFEDDVHERTLGPGFRELVEATAEARRDDEPVLVWSSTKGLDIARATYLARLVDGEARLFAPGAPVSGLSLFVGVKPSGAVLARTEAGVLARRRER